MKSGRFARFASQLGFGWPILIEDEIGWALTGGWMELTHYGSMGLEALESRQFLSVAPAGDVPSAPVVATPLAVAASRHHAHYLHHLHTLHHLAHMHRVHMHRVHHLHVLHKAHVLRTTVPEPIVLTAQQRTNWAAIRDVFLANRKRF